MRTSLRCPKCEHLRVLHIVDALGRVGSPARVGRTDAYVCERCRYTEFYAVDPIAEHGEGVRLLGPQSAPEPEAVEPRRLGRVSVVLVRADSNPVAVAAALRLNLRLSLRDAHAMLTSTPVTVVEGVDRASADRLRRALESAGAAVDFVEQEPVDRARLGSGEEY